MTTSQFIKMLQEADPSGEAHIRMEGGIPLFAELKPGYWDGPYEYIDEDDNYVTSTEKDKIDIHCLSIWDFIEQHTNLPWEEVKKKFKFKLNYSGPQKSEREEAILKKAKEAYDEHIKIENECYERSLQSMIKNAEKGWTWFQNKEIDLDKNSLHVYYTWKIFDETGKEMGSNVHMTEVVFKSGLWERVDNNKIDGYYEWVFKK